MRVLVLGAGGQLGRALQASAPQGVEVTALARHELDITDAGAVLAQVRSARPEVVFNAAGYTAVDQAEAEPEKAFAINGAAAGAIAAAAAAAGARMVQVSTDFVFDGRLCRPYRPDDATGPLSVYGASKLAGETAVLGASPDALVVRTAWVYDGEGRNFLRTMLRLFSERPQVQVVTDQVGTPTSASSLARALWGLVLEGAEGVHHFTDAGVASWYDFAVAIHEEAIAAGLTGGGTRIVPIPTSKYPTPAQRPSYAVLDKGSAWAILGGPANHWRHELRAILGSMNGKGDV